MAWLNGWIYRKQVNITGQSGAGTLYQVELSIGASASGDFHLQNHCINFPQDIRFTDNDGETLLDYWVEDLTADPIKVWVKVADDLGSNQSIYCYYGKSGESSGSNGTNTFEFFDDFESVEDNWTSRSNASQSSEEAYEGTYSGKLCLSAGVYGNLIKTWTTSPIILEWASKLHSTGEVNRMFWGGNRNGKNYLIGMNESNTYAQVVDTTVHDTNVPKDYEWHTYKIVFSATDIKFYIDGILKHTTESAPSLTEWRFYGGHGVSYHDIVRVRKYASPEPAFATAGDEESVSFMEIIEILDSHDETLTNEGEIEKDTVIIPIGKKNDKYYIYAVSLKIPPNLYYKDLINLKIKAQVRTAHGSAQITVVKLSENSITDIFERTWHEVWSTITEKEFGTYGDSLSFAQSTGLKTFYLNANALENLRAAVDFANLTGDYVYWTLGFRLDEDDPTFYIELEDASAFIFSNADEQVMSNSDLKVKTLGANNPAVFLNIDTPQKIGETIFCTPMLKFSEIKKVIQTTINYSDSMASIRAFAESFNISCTYFLERTGFYQNSGRTITHSLGLGTYLVALISTADWNADIGEIYIASLLTNSFTIYNSGAGKSSFSWLIFDNPYELGDSTFNGSGGQTVNHSKGDTNYVPYIIPSADGDGAIGEWWITDYANTSFMVRNSGSAVTTLKWAIARYNNGSKGSSSFAGSSGVTITHNLGIADYTPLIIPTVDPGGQLGAVYVTDITTNSFIVRNTGSAITAFDWIIPDMKAITDNSLFKTYIKKTSESLQLNIERVFNIWKKIARYLSFTVTSLIYEHFPLANSFQITEDTIKSTPTKRPNETVNFDIAKKSTIKVKISEVFQSSISILAYEALKLAESFSSGIDITKKSFNKFLQTVIDITSQPIDLSKATIFAHFEEAFHSVINLTKSQVVYHLSEGFSTTVNIAKVVLEKKISEILEMTQILKKAAILIKNEGFSLMEKSWSHYDYGAACGVDLDGYYGAEFDGRYVYFVPYQNDSGYFGDVMRYDTQGDFTNINSWSHYDYGAACGVDLDGYCGAEFDGRYVYFVPDYNGSGYVGDVMRYDTQGDFTNINSWSHYDYGAACGVDLDGFHGAEFDGRYVYFVPNYNGSDYFGDVMRYDTQGDFTNINSWSHYDYGAACGVDLDGYFDAEFDGRYVYFVPDNNGSGNFGDVMRYDTQGDFTNINSWSHYDYGAACGVDLCGYYGVEFDDRYVYFVPNHNSSGHFGDVMRYDTQGDFTNINSWSHYDYGEACGVDLDGYYGAEFDGRYVYFVPDNNGSGAFGDVMRYDTQGDFTNINSWSHYDYGAACGVDLDGYRGAEFDGRYVYFVPCDNGYDYFGDVMRYDTERDFTKNIKLKKSILKSLSETLNNSISLIKNINLILSEKISSLLLFSQYEFAKFEEAFHVLENLAKTAIKIDIENFSIVCTVSRVWTRKLIENINLTFLNKKTFFTTKIGNLAINIDKKIKIRGLLGRIKISSKTRNLILKRKVPDKKIKLRIDKRKIELNK